MQLAVIEKRLIEAMALIKIFNGVKTTKEFSYVSIAENTNGEDFTMVTDKIIANNFRDETVIAMGYKYPYTNEKDVTIIVPGKLRYFRLSALNKLIEYTAAIGADSARAKLEEIKINYSEWIKGIGAFRAEMIDLMEKNKTDVLHLSYPDLDGYEMLIRKPAFCIVYKTGEEVKESISGLKDYFVFNLNDFNRVQTQDTSDGIFLADKFEDIAIICNLLTEFAVRTGNLDINIINFFK